MKNGLLILCALLFVVACGKTQEGMDLPTSNLSTITQAPALTSAKTRTTMKVALNEASNSGAYGTCTVRRQADGSLAWSISAAGLPPGTTAKLFIVSQDDLYEDLVDSVVSTKGIAKSGRRHLSPAPLSGAGVSCAITDQAVLMANTTIFSAP